MIGVGAPAKVNLLLRVLAREESGFHQIETLFLAIALEDRLTLILREKGGVCLHAPPLCPVEENLAYRAATAFLKEIGFGGGLEIHLEKLIPAGGGLGGGSSDAAAVLKGLATMFPGGISARRILEIGASLGSDVPFFLSPTPIAWAWGRGNRMLSLPALPEAPMLLAIPPSGMGTERAYALLARKRLAEGAAGGLVPSVLEEDAFSGWESVARLAHNDFEDVVFEAVPDLQRLRSALDSCSPRVTLLAGSGSTVFALFHSVAEAEEARARLESRFPDTRFLLTMTRSGMPDPSFDEGVPSSFLPGG